MALSRGGKDGLAASSRIILQGKLAFGPAFSPEADGVGMKAQSSSGCHVGKRGEFVQEQDELGALPKRGRGRSSGRESSGLGEELIGEGRAIARGWP